MDLGNDGRRQLTANKHVPMTGRLVGVVGRGRCGCGAVAVVVAVEMRAGSGGEG